MDALPAVLMAWIAAHSPYDTAAMPLPEIREMTPRALTRRYYGALAQTMPGDGVDDRINALYARGDGPQGTIYILAAARVAGAGDYADPHDNPLWHEILLHELVHHVQWQAGAVTGWACLNQGEHEAYRLGGLWLHQQAVPDPLPNRIYWGHLASRC